MNLDDSLRDKQITNGPFDDMAQLAQAIKFALRRGRNWEALPPEAKETLELIATRIAKILCGDAVDPNHWNEIAVLGRIRSKALEPKPENAKLPASRLNEVAQARIRAFQEPDDA